VEYIKQKAKVNEAKPGRLNDSPTSRMPPTRGHARRPHAQGSDVANVWQTVGAHGDVARLDRPESWPTRMTRSAPETDLDARGPAFDPDADDGALAAACVAGARDAFDVLVRRHQRAVYQVCYRFAGNHADASDLAQEAFVRAYRALPRFKGDAALGTWLHRIAVNVGLNHVAARRSRADRTSDEPVDRHDAVDLRAERPDAPVEREQHARAVRAAIAKLPKKQRATVVLRVYRELPHEEIARILGSSVGTVKANFFHALGNLRRLLRDETRR
jgi:RNA polymerase sigma-70 factor (ECF subfamily)